MQQLNASGGSREGARGTGAPLILDKKNKISQKKEKPAGRAKQNHPHPQPPCLAQGLDLPLNAKVFSEIESPFMFFLACEQDMETLFVNEFSNASLHVLKAGDEKAISIGSTWSSCELDLNHSWYFGCSDSRLSSSIYLQTMMNLLTLIKGDFYFNLKVRNCGYMHVYSVSFVEKNLSPRSKNPSYVKISKN